MQGLSLSSVRGGLAAVLTAASVLLAALVFAVLTQDQPLAALAVPAILGTAVLCARWPAAALALIIAFSGSFGSLQAFGLFSPGPFVDLLLAGLWVSVLVSHAISKRDRPWSIWPGVALLFLYIVITFFEIATALSVRIGLESFRYSTWYMLALPLVALAGWRLRTYIQISKAIVAITVIVAGYAVLRLLIGPAAQESEFALQSAGIFNLIDDRLALIGSFTGRHELAFWVTCAAPFCLAAGLTTQGAWRLVAISATGLCCVAALGTEVRAALPGVLGGCGAVVVLHQLSGEFRAANLGRTIAASAVALILGAGLFTWVLGEDTSRYGAILSPSGDVAYEQRLVKWEQALADIDDAPFGNGLGSAGRIQELALTPYRTVGAYSLDNSYLKIAYEQGFPVLALFVAAMLTLLVGLGRQALRVKDGTTRGIAIGGVGTLVAGLSMFFTGLHIENLIALVLWIPVGTAVGAIHSQGRSKPPTFQPTRAEPPVRPSREVGAPA